MICNNQKLSETFLRKYFETVDWDIIIFRQKLTIPFMKDFIYKFDLNTLLLEQKVNEDFLTEFYELLTEESWEIISERLNFIDFSIKFIEDNMNKFNVNILFKFLSPNYISQEKYEHIIYIFRNKINWSMPSYYRIFNFISEEFIINNFEIIEFNLDLLTNRQVSVNFIDKLHNKINWKNICYWQKLPENVLEKYKKYLDWNIVWEKQECSSKFIEKNINFVNWELVSIHQNLNENFIKKYKDKLNWEAISFCQKMSEDFLLEFSNKIQWKIFFGTSLFIDGFYQTKKKELIRKRYSSDFIKKYLKYARPIDKYRFLFIQNKYLMVLSLCRQLNIPEDIEGIFCDYIAVDSYFEADDYMNIISY
jgi:hypothetical protein